jgi:alpha-glucosidase
MNSVDTHWWQNATVYQLYVRSFADSNGDGIGDLAGITSRLDYLAELGVDGIWLNPCYPSPQADHGYDVADYMNIEPDYGDLQAIDELIAAAHDRNIKLLMDIVPNHCSKEHAWFTKAVADGPGSEAREWFWFRDGKGERGELAPNNWQAWFGGSAWTRVTEPDGRLGQWYLHLFTPDQPDVNWNHEPLRAAFDDILRFWFDRGVDGFRIDAPAVVGKTPGLPDADPVPDGTPATAIASLNVHHYHRPEVHELFARWRRVADDYQRAHPDRSLVFVGETFAPSLELVTSYVSHSELHTTFLFDLVLNNWEAHRWTTTIRALTEQHAAGRRLAMTLNNHDAQRNVTRFGRADAHLPSSYTFNNLVNSDEPVDATVGLQRARASAVFLCGLDVPIFLYAGEELGLPEVIDLPEDALQDPIWERSGRTQRGRDGCRVPLPWTAEPSNNFGFSASDADATAPSWLPQPPYFGEFSVENQQDDPSSTLALYRELLSQRRDLSVASPGEFAWYAFASGTVCYRRNELTVVMNFGPSTVLLPPEFGDIVISSTPIIDRLLPVDSAVWLRSS